MLLRAAPALAGADERLLPHAHEMGQWLPACGYIEQAGKSPPPRALSEIPLTHTNAYFILAGNARIILREF